MSNPANQSKSFQKHLPGAFAFLLLIVANVRSSQAQTPDQPVSAEAVPQLRHERRVLVSIPHRQLALIQDGTVTKIYPVAVGAASSPSPTGSFQIKNRLVKPTYFHPGTVIPAGPDNPLGTRWIGLNSKGYGIHGTNVEQSVGKAASHGCIRMHRADLEELFTRLQVGDKVEIRGQLDDEIAGIFGTLPETEETATPQTVATGEEQGENSAADAAIAGKENNF